METFELKKEQLKLAPRIELRDNFSKINTVGGAVCVAQDENVLATVVVCEYPSMKLLEKKSYLLPSALPYKIGYEAYREMPAIIEAYNQLNQEPDLLLVKGTGILHPRRIGIASHLGLVLNQATMGVSDKLHLGKVESGKIRFNNELVGFEFKTREHAKPVYATPGHLVSLGSVLSVISECVKYPHKMPEPIHLANKIANKKIKKNVEEKKIIEQ